MLLPPRVTGFVPGAPEFALGLLSADDSVGLLMECAGEKAGIPPHNELQYKAVELCGNLPLVLSIGTCFAMRMRSVAAYYDILICCALPVPTNQPLAFSSSSTAASLTRRSSRYSRPIMQRFCARASWATRW